MSAETVLQLPEKETLNDTDVIYVVDANEKELGDFKVPISKIFTQNPQTQYGYTQWQPRKFGIAKGAIVFYNGQQYIATQNIPANDPRVPGTLNSPWENLYTYIILRAQLPFGIPTYSPVKIEYWEKKFGTGNVARAEGQSFQISDEKYRILYDHAVELGMIVDYDTKYNSPENWKGFYGFDGATLYLPDYRNTFIRALGDSTNLVGIRQNDALQAHNHGKGLVDPRGVSFTYNEEGSLFYTGDGAATEPSGTQTTTLITQYTPETVKTNQDETRVLNYAWYCYIRMVPD